MRTLPEVALISLFASVARADSDGREWVAQEGTSTASVIAGKLPKGYRCDHVMIPMRDGTKLATTVFLPPGEGTWATVLVRTPYGRAAGAKYFPGICAKGSYACVVQDLRGDGDSEGTPPAEPSSSDNEIADSYDTLEWITRQPWSNRRIGMLGGSGHGMAAVMAYFSKHPHLVVIQAPNSAGNTALSWAFENGVRRGLFDWLAHRNVKVTTWPRPTLLAYDRKKWERILEEAATDNHTVFLASDGWFNIFGDASLDLFEKCAPHGTIHLTMAASIHGHQCDKGVKFPIKPLPSRHPAPDFLDVLDGRAKPAGSRLVYAVLGDLSRPDARGNEQRVTAVWPPAHTPQRWYLAQNGTLARTPPSEAGAVHYTYDPADPVPSLGGGWSFGNEPNGAVDQRPLAERKDAIRFLSAPLPAPLDVAGKIQADLWVASSAPDTLFVVKLTDVYPDGREILLREAAAMARYRDGFDHPAPLTPGKPARLTFDCNSIAAVLNTGHRIGVLITSSSHPAYEVHPNTFQPARDWSQAQTARQTILTGPSFPSAIILPEVSPKQGQAIR